MNSPLAKLVPAKASPDELEAIKRDGWREHGILVVAVGDDRLTWVEREQVNQLGDRLYGKKG